jgi:PhzF family phenazine biosynthesis protein
MNLSLYQIDAFTNRLFSGNPAAVVPLEEWLPDAVLQSIAMENNLSETAFFVPNGKDFDLRWFTPAIEVNFCGHATLASAHTLYHHLGFAGEKITFHTHVGTLTVAREGDNYRMDFPADRLTPVPDPPADLLNALGVKAEAAFKGREDYLIIAGSEAEVAALQPDFRALLRLGGRGILVSAPGREVDFVSRCFFPNAGIDEDPVTGSAHTTMTPYWAQRLGKTKLTARQISARGGELHCEIRGDRVVLLGQAVTYMIGRIEGLKD